MALLLELRYTKFTAKFRSNTSNYQINYGQWPCRTIIDSSGHIIIFFFFGGGGQTGPCCGSGRLLTFAGSGKRPDPDLDLNKLSNYRPSFFWKFVWRKYALKSKGTHETKSLTTDSLSFMAFTHTKKVEIWPFIKVKIWIRPKNIASEASKKRELVKCRRRRAAEDVPVRGPKAWKFEMDLIIKANETLKM
jgi:hypothetical protein